MCAVSTGKLLEKLEDEGPFTVFAPTNEAFVALLAEKGVELEDVMADKESLAKLIKLHVVDGKVKAADIIAMAEPREARCISLQTVSSLAAIK